MIELAQITSNIHVLKKIPFFLKNISQHSQNRNWSKRWFYNSQCNCFQKTCWFNKNKKSKGTMLPSKSLIHSCLVIHTLQTKTCCWKNILLLLFRFFSTAEILQIHISNCFKIEINGKKIIKMSKKGGYVRLKNYEKKIISTLIV